MASQPHLSWWVAYKLPVNQLLQEETDDLCTDKAGLGMERACHDSHSKDLGN